MLFGVFEYLYMVLIFPAGGPHRVMDCRLVQSPNWRPTEVSLMRGSGNRRGGTSLRESSNQCLAEASSMHRSSDPKTAFIRV